MGKKLVATVAAAVLVLVLTHVPSLPAESLCFPAGAADNRSRWNLGADMTCSSHDHETDPAERHAGSAGRGL